MNTFKGWRRSSILKNRSFSWSWWKWMSTIQSRNRNTKTSYSGSSRSVIRRSKKDMKNWGVYSLNSRCSSKKHSSKIWMNISRRNMCFGRNSIDLLSSFRKKRKITVSRCFRCSRFRRCNRKSMRNIFRRWRICRGSRLSRIWILSPRRTMRSRVWILRTINWETRSMNYNSKYPN